MFTTPSAASGGGAVITSASFMTNLSTLGLGYAIAIALGFLVLLSTILLASYICCRHHHHPPHLPPPNPNNPHEIIVPRIIFVAEDDEEDDDDHRVPGLDQSVINSYPKFPFTNGSTGDSMCSICLCDYKESEMLRMMPDCRHFFHLYCVDAWLRLHASCPVCRNSPLPTPLSTPLSEVVPLSQYTDNRRRSYIMYLCTDQLHKNLRSEGRNSARYSTHYIFFQLLPVVALLRFQGNSESVLADSIF